MFRILVVDDNPTEFEALRNLMRSVPRPHELYSASHGLDALDFLRCRPPYVDARRPNLILLDINMPRMDGFEFLAEVKTDAELCVIPVIVLSESDSPQDIRKAYEGHANCYVQKPRNLERANRVIQAVEAFWMDVAILPACDELPIGRWHAAVPK